MRYPCGEERRRAEIAARPDLNAIDFIEVLDTSDQAEGDRQRTLFVHFVHDPTGLGLTAGNVVVTGGERIRGIRVVAATVQVDSRSGSTQPVLVVQVDRAGDFATYRLSIVDVSGVDSELRTVDFSFKVNCETGFDPQPALTRVALPQVEPTLDYLARDFPGLRQLMLDRLAVLVPDWQERNPADLGITLVELLAYLGDQLSYRQDAVATEAYLGTCRLRTSARRHARLVDYAMHDGCNARVWVRVRLLDGVGPFELRDAMFTSAVPGLPPSIRPGTVQHNRVRDAGAIVFRQIHPVRLAPAHNEMRFHTWGGRECGLPEGAVRATLRGALPDLSPGAVIVFVEARSPRTGDPDDADLSHRHAVRLTEVTPGVDPLGRRFDAEPGDDPLPVTEIAWAQEDALPFPLCLSAEATGPFGRAFIADVSVAWGNIVLADHGDDVEEPIGTVPPDSLRQIDPDREYDREVLAPARFRPVLGRGPVTQAAPVPPNDLISASAALRFEPGAAAPDISLSDGTTQPWSARRDLLDSRPTDRHFVVEVEADGHSRLRFGDGHFGERPAAGRIFTARYRVGNGRVGNVGADALVHIITGQDGVLDVANPLAAAGGVDMETIEEVRQHAPFAFRPQVHSGQPDRPDGRSLRRAVTPADYAAVTETHPEVQRAAATFRWTGSWRTVSVTVDRLAGAADPVTAPFRAELEDYLEQFRLAGHEVEVEPPRSVAVDIAMRVQIAPGFFASHVRRALLAALSNRLLPDGRRGAFHPDNLTFGQTLYLSPLYQAAQAIDGVTAVDITTFQRRDQPGSAGLAAGRLTFGRLEIARLDNDPNFPERGSLALTIEEGI